MSLWKRLKNLWKLSAIELPEGKKAKPITDIIEDSVREAFNYPRKAKIVDMDDPLDKFMKNT